MTEIAIVGESMCALESVETIRKHGRSTKVVMVFVPKNLPSVIDNLDDVRSLIPSEVFEADVVLDYSKHMDFPEVLKEAKKVVSVIKSDIPNVVSVKCFCSVIISEEFGIPEFEVELEKVESEGKTKNKIKKIRVIRSSPCGAAYSLAEKLTGMEAKEALSKAALAAQNFCRGSGGPSGTIHKASEIHRDALLRALSKCGFNI